MNKTNNNPLVSVVVPCLNRAHFLRMTIDSILQQDYPNIECIVVDGGSKDNTVEILKSYGDKIRWVSEPDKGHVDAINKGWFMSRGDILAWLNADDYYIIPHTVTTAVEYFKNYPQTDLIYGDCVTVSENGSVIDRHFKSRPWNLEYAVKYCHYTITQATSFIKRKILQKVNWLDPEFNYCKDHELWLRIGLVGTIRHLPIKLAYVRAGKGISQDPEVSEAKVRLTEKFFELPDLPSPFNLSKFRQRAMSNAYLIGSNYARIGHHYKIFVRYLIKALYIDPLNLPYIIYNLFIQKIGFLFQRLPRKLKDRIIDILGFER